MVVWTFDLVKIESGVRSTPAKAHAERIMKGLRILHTPKMFGVMASCSKHSEKL